MSAGGFFATMEESALHAWETFYVIVGSSGAALTGLQFVAVALAAERKPTGEQVGAFGTPTVFHFSFALLIAAIATAPWRSIGGPAAALALSGVGGVVYAVIVARRARRQDGYAMVMEDWIWHVALPFCAYATLLCGALGLHWHAGAALFAVAAATLLLLFIGIHNAWDAVAWFVVERAKTKRGAPQ